MSASPTILCIDDEAAGLQIRKAVLEHAGYRVLTATDGRSGLSLFGGQSVDAVVLDYSMPGMDGGQVARAMRTSKPYIPILLLSAYVVLPDEVLKVIDIFVTKGEGPETLLSKIVELLGRFPEREGSNG